MGLSLSWHCSHRSVLCLPRVSVWFCTCTSRLERINGFGGIHEKLSHRWVKTQWTQEEKNSYGIGTTFHFTFPNVGPFLLLSGVISRQVFLKKVPGSDPAHSILGSLWGPLGSPRVPSITLFRCWSICFKRFCVLPRSELDLHSCVCSFIPTFNRYVLSAQSPLRPGLGAFHTSGSKEQEPCPLPLGIMAILVGGEDDKRGKTFQARRRAQARGKSQKTAWQVPGKNCKLFKSAGR